MCTFNSLHIDSVTIAKAICFSAEKQGDKAMGMTKVQKILYIIFGLYLAKYKTLLTDEIPYAWAYGPVFKNVYDVLSRSDTKITKDDFEIIESRFPNVATMIDAAVETYKLVSAATLSNWTHKEGSPWSKALERTNYSWGTLLSLSEVYEYFLSLTKHSVK